MDSSNNKWYKMQIPIKRYGKSEFSSRYSIICKENKLT